MIKLLIISLCFLSPLWLYSLRLCGFVAKIPRNLRNPLLLKGLRAYTAFYNCRDTFTDVMSALQIHLFLTNKANFRKVKFDVNRVLTKDYDRIDTWSIRKNKPNSNPIQTQYKPKQTQFKPNLSRRSLWRSRNLSRRSLWRSRIKPNKMLKN
jgi:hypothetical protein